MFDRREILRIGALSLCGLSIGKVATAGEASRRKKLASTIFVMLQGGPSHIDLWDPKPDAPQEVRGKFKPIDTHLPGLRVGELLPHTAAIANQLAIVRSMRHQFTNHIAGTYVTLTGSTDQPDADREAAAKDFPGPGAVLNYLQETPPQVPVSVSLPNWLSIPGPSNRMPGQYGGFLGTTYDPFLVAGEPQKAGFKPLSLTLPDDMDRSRLEGRKTLLQQLDAETRSLESQGTKSLDRLSATAYQMLTDPRMRRALDLDRESDKMRERYGLTKIGQSLLLARRLIEAGVRFVGFNEFNQHWDDHSSLFNNYPKKVAPVDQAHSALVTDLADRGLLDETLVILTGEFGRTPTINKDGGRDHWPRAYSTVLAGGGVRGGQVYGSSDTRGSDVATLPVSPADLLATMWHCMGVDPGAELRDKTERPYKLCTGRVVNELF